MGLIPTTSAYHQQAEGSLGRTRTLSKSHNHYIKLSSVASLWSRWHVKVICETLDG